MKRLTLILFLPLLAAGGAKAIAQETNSTNRQDLRSFDIVVENNIFDQSRTGLRGLARPAVHQPRVERLTFLGVAGDSGKADLFFGGNGANSDRPLKVGDHVDGFEVKGATLDSVQLVSSSNTFVLNVQNSLRRVDNGPWEKSFDEYDSTPVASSTSVDASSAPSASAAATDAAHPGESAIERKLRLRREQEEK
ncbi:MAG TPA: hypothetical protein VH595_08030 [Verrucomicrobiae bacterium]|jgi:hypothetical protein|nr:hypothetical protein [Verrucomicrobiae bacterium]